MKRAYIFVIALLVFAYIPVQATIIEIPYDYPTIQEGIDVSHDGDTVLVHPGTYVENINFNGHNIVLGSLFLMTGDTTYIAETVIDGNESGSVVTFESGEDSTSAISGFTLQNGYDYAFGGGIICLSSSPVISHNIIQNNIVSSLTTAGGGILCTGSSSKIVNNLIRDNHARGVSFGGGIYCDCANSLIIGNRIINNSSGYGGGICGWGSVIIANNSIVGNYAAEGAGIICGDDILIANNTISRNISIVQGGGIYCWSPNSIIINSIVYENEPDEVFLRIELPPEIVYCNIQGGWPGEGNIDADPLFRDPENGDFHLMSTACGDSFDSPCIDAGHPDILDSLLNCSWGLGAIRSDMGAYGGGDSLLVGIDYDEIPSPDRFSVSQNYPNPFNASTLIRYTLPEPSDVIITIYDILGRRVETLINENQQAGYRQITWDASNQSSGMYFYRIQAGEYAETKKMVLLK